jgi:ribonuclease HI
MPHDASPFLLPADAVLSLEQLIRDLGRPVCDLLLVGDGSGSVYSLPAGWACTAYDRRKRRAVLHAGAVSGGTNNFAELAPYLQALWYHHQEHGQKPNTPVRVVIVSDSELTVRCGNRQYGRNCNLCLWAGIDWFEQNGYRLTWRHVRRNTNAWNAWADAVAGQLRSFMSRMPPSLPVPPTPADAGSVAAGPLG